MPPDTMPSYCTVSCDLNPPAVHSHSLLPHPVPDPSILIPPLPPSLNASHPNSLFWIDVSQGKPGIGRRWQIPTVRGEEGHSPCRPEVCLPDTV